MTTFEARPERTSFFESQHEAYEARIESLHTPLTCRDTQAQRLGFLAAPIMLATPVNPATRPDSGLESYRLELEATRDPIILPQLCPRLVRS